MRQEEPEDTEKWYTKLFWLPIDLLEWYLNMMFDGHILLRLSVNLIIGTVGWILFVLLHHIF